MPQEPILPTSEPGDLPITDKRQEAFCLYMIMFHNQTRAATIAGYKDPDVQGSRLMKQSRIQNRIRFLQNTVLLDREINLDMIINEYGVIAFTNLSDFINIDDDGRVRVLPSEVLGVKSKAIKKLKYQENVGKDGTVTSRRMEIELHDKMRALDAFREYLGMTRKDEQQGKLGTEVTDTMNKAALITRETVEKEKQRLIELLRMKKSDPDNFDKEDELTDLAKRYKFFIR